MTDRKYLAFGILAIAVIGIILICGCTGQPGATGQTTPTPAGASPSPAPSQSNQPTATPTPSQLKIVVKDYGLPEVKYLQPTITEIQLQNQSKGWVTIWSSPEGKTVKLTSDGAEIVLDSVSLEAGTYIGAKLKVTTVDVEVDINRDGDTIDKNVEVIMTKAEFDLLPPGERPSGSQQPPSSPSPPPQPPSPSPPEGPPPELQAPPASQGTLYLKEPPSGQEPPSGPQQPPAPSQPPGPSKPSKPEWSPGVTFDGNYVHMGVFLDEVHTATFNDFFVPLWGKDFVYGGSGGTIVFDFTLHPCLPKHEQVSVEVSTET
ncbi:MAG: hypothetical protein NT067_01945 [Candidatus Diapherotrites archaeon]|nr:hypothetical protein [Candidatus Diapherotrites archaeon]